MKDLIAFEKGVINTGDDSRIRQVMRRAANGEALTIAFLGGSITQGCLASTPEGCYAYLTYAWWKEAFPKADFTYINAGIGGTTSHLGTGRVEEDVLQYEPDFVIVEFSVNDADDSAHFQETYEGLVRRILKAPSAPALLLVHNVRYDDGGNAEQIHAPVGAYYHLPSVSMKPTIYAQVAAGNIKNRDITQDDLHPNDAGHALVAGVITHYLQSVKEAVENDAAAWGQDTPFGVLPRPLTANGYENAHRYRNDELQPVLCEGFVKDETEQSAVSDCFKKGFMASRKGDKIVFEAEGASIGVQYKKTMKGPVPKALLTLDGDTAHPILLDGNFDEDWDCLYLETILEHGEHKMHRIEIELTEAHENDAEPFYLVSLIVAG
ncbi:MAG: SGNH/GDSL hydrolase family protein [Lachnospiraceae bacterium]